MADRNDLLADIKRIETDRLALRDVVQKSVPLLKAIHALPLDAEEDTEEDRQFQDTLGRLIQQCDGLLRGLGSPRTVSCSVCHEEIAAICDDCLDDVRDQVREQMGAAG